MLVAYSTSKPLPASSWELAVMSSAAVKDIQEVACSKVTRFGASYLPNKYYRLFRDVLSSSDLASLSLRLEVPDPSVCLMFRVFAADTLELLHETQARKVIQIHQLKPAAPPADGEVQSSSVIIDALLNEKTMAMPEHCKSRRPYFSRTNRRRRRSRALQNQKQEQKEKAPRSNPARRRLLRRKRPRRRSFLRGFSPSFLEKM